MNKSKALMIRNKEALPINIIREEKTEVQLNGKTLIQNKDYTIGKFGEIVLSKEMKRKIAKSKSYSLSCYQYKSMRQEGEIDEHL